MGVDLCGPIFVKNMHFDGHGRMYKMWVVFYTCTASRGVVLDFAREYGVGAIMKIFCRFISRGGFADKILSEYWLNCTAEETQTFVGKFGVD